MTRNSQHHTEAKLRSHACGSQEPEKCEGKLPFRETTPRHPLIEHSSGPQPKATITVAWEPFLFNFSAASKG
eukprot:CAMPEP_0177466208 /NCGR_PEP_ID=MMETSP0369-20130122/17840_1 /TAXON_ID=447022 ORGANISM="Scrippsiella hangoei-like, Strain SHHI-4" /NCGR_SAMPLE_ID=MMETSP0369 /ASSEMBLY_ACC=CAM_ASM_000364 /LENGTH=71 /DNA_ID=CAMNT_0018940175 /DNA_START=51 /DNA_END=263 /DNA_ORIENTATION=+